MNSQSIRKPIHDIYTPATREAVEKYNAALNASDATRRAAETEREQIAADAVAGLCGAAKLQERANALRLSLLDADINELGAVRSLPELDKQARADWEREEKRLSEVAAAREAALSKQFKKIGLTDDQLAAALGQDPEYADACRARRDAEEARLAGLRGHADAARSDELERSIMAAAKRL